MLSEITPHFTASSHTVSGQGTQFVLGHSYAKVILRVYSLLFFHSSVVFSAILLHKKVDLKISPVFILKKDLLALLLHVVIIFFE